MGQLSLPSGSRIRRNAEVRRSFDCGRSAASGALVAYAFDRADGRPARYALVVSRRWGNAVRRNRVRRLLREAFRTARPDLAVGFDFVLLPRRDFGDAGMEDVRRWLLHAAPAAAARFAADGPADPALARGRRGRKRR